MIRYKAGDILHVMRHCMIVCPRCDSIGLRGDFDSYGVLVCRDCLVAEAESMLRERKCREKAEEWRGEEAERWRHFRRLEHST